MTDSGANPQIEADQTEENDYYVVDPDDYQQTRRLKQIDQAKKRVRDVRDNRVDLDVDEYEFELAQAVAYYGLELVPLIDDALDEGTIERDQLNLFRIEGPDGTETINVYDFVQKDGCVKSEPGLGGKTKLVPLKPPNTMQVYARLNRIVRDLGLGLEFEEDKGPAQI